MLVKDVLAYSHGPICWKCGKCYPQEKSQSMQPWISVGKTNALFAGQRGIALTTENGSKPAARPGLTSFFFTD